MNKKKVAFICVHNSCRSQIAEALGKHLRGDDFDFYSAGTETKPLINGNAGIPYYGQHALRHTFATRCIETGIQPVVLKGWLGHTNIHVTLDTYADVFDRMNLGAISKFEDYMDKVLQGEE